MIYKFFLFPLLGVFLFLAFPHATPISYADDPYFKRNGYYMGMSKADAQALAQEEGLIPYDMRYNPNGLVFSGATLEGRPETYLFLMDFNDNNSLFSLGYWFGPLPLDRKPELVELYNEMEERFIPLYGNPFRKNEIMKDDLYKTAEWMNSDIKVFMSVPGTSDMFWDDPESNYFLVGYQDETGF